MCVSWAEPGCIILDNVLGYMHYWVMLCEGWSIAGGEGVNTLSKYTK